MNNMVFVASDCRNTVEEIRATFKRFMPAMTVVGAWDIGAIIPDEDSSISSLPAGKLATIKAHRAFMALNPRMNVLAEVDEFMVEQFGCNPGRVTEESPKVYPVERINLNESRTAWNHNHMCFMKSDMQDFEDWTKFIHLEKSVVGSMTNESGSYPDYYQNSFIPMGFDRPFPQLGKQFIETSTARAKNVIEIICWLQNTSSGQHY